MLGERQLIFRFRLSLVIFMTALVVSGLTAFPLRWELDVLCGTLGVSPNPDLSTVSGLTWWVAFVRQGLRESFGAYPFLAYGTDWLAFAHITIAVYFIGPLMKPTSNTWVLVAGMISCGLVIPLALIAGPIRGIPFYWRLIDCSFGVFGVLPLAYCYSLSRKIRLIRAEST